jgi:hypothetical protein
VAVDKVAGSGPGFEVLNLSFVTTELAESVVPRVRQHRGLQVP